ncbi:MAG TPA: methyltransferase domain-containing protein [Acidimicrobiales bacterium]|nr:methyltransferase domain-containing protein [Acidimicrobiales bacterium]
MHLLELEPLPGLADTVAAEVARVFADRAREVEVAESAVRIELRGDPRDVLDLRTAVAAYLVCSYAVPRPKALLGDQHLRSLLAQLEDARAVSSFTSFRFGAAGRESAVFARLASAVAGATGLAHDPDGGELLLRVRPATDGWEVLARLSPRPLSARAWRVRDVPGALNATIAAAMVEWSEPSPDDRVLNAMSGSATLLIERAARTRSSALVGVDLDAAILGDARANLAAAGTAASLVRADTAHLPFPDAAFDVVLADPPYGHRMGSHAGNESLYAALLSECARVTTPAARLVLVTHELKRFESVLRHGTAWEVAATHQVFQKGHHPKVWVLQKA